MVASSSSRAASAAVRFEAVGLVDKSFPCFLLCDDCFDFPFAFAPLRDDRRFLPIPDDEERGSGFKTSSLTELREDIEEALPLLNLRTGDDRAVPVG